MLARSFILPILLIFLMPFHLALGNCTEALNLQKAKKYTEAALLYPECLRKTEQINEHVYDSAMALVNELRFRGYFKQGLELLDSLIAIFKYKEEDFFKLQSEITKGDFLRFVDFEESLRHLKKIKLEDLASHPKALSRYYHRLAAVYNVLSGKRNDSLFLDSALFALNKSLNIAKAIDFEDAKATCYNEMAAVYLEKQYPQKALPYFDSAAVIFEKISLINYVNVRTNISRLYLKIGEYRKAVKSLEEVIVIASNNQWHSYLYPQYQIVADAYWELGDTIKSYEYRIKEFDFYNKHLEVQAEKELLKFRVQSELAEKENAIALKNLEINVAKTQGKFLIVFLAITALLLIAIGFLFLNVRAKNRKLIKLIEENEFLLGETNHRIKNNLQLIVSLLAREKYDLVKGEINQIQEITSKIESIATLHKQLYLNNEKSMVSTLNYLKELIANFDGFIKDKNIQFITEIEDFDIANEKATYLGLLLTELITNTLKHAFKTNVSNPCIKFKLWSNQNKIMLEYFDNGSGINEKKEIKLATLLVAQLKGHMELNSENKFDFKVVFPS